MNTERRHKVTFTMKEVVAALKAHRPTCITTQAIPAHRPIHPGVYQSADPATMGLPTPQTLDFVWTRQGITETSE